MAEAGAVAPARRIEIRAPGAEPASPLALGIVIEPGAFGSGEHDTTASCLELLVSLPLAGCSVLDLGCGTGVLAIAALLLGARQAVAVDPAAGAIACAAANGLHNGIADRWTLVAGELDDVAPASFDVVVANLYADLLLGLADDLVARTAPRGWILLSGILWELDFELRRRLDGLGCELRAHRFLEEHTTQLWQRS